MVAVGGAFATDNEYWTECEAVEEAPVTVTAYVPIAAVVLLMVREAEEPAANDCGLTVADTDPFAGDTAVDRAIVVGELICVDWTVLDVPPPAVTVPEDGLSESPKSPAAVPAVVTLTEAVSDDTEPSEARALTW
jgi:hypothetical protein